MRSPNRFNQKFALVLLGLLVVGCGEQSALTAPTAAAVKVPASPTANASLAGAVGGVTTVVGGLTNVVNNLLVCTLQLDEQGSAVVGPSGGHVQFGSNSLDIPRGALRTTQRITGHMIRGHDVRVEFSPSGLQFSAPATLQMNYAGCIVGPTPAEVVYLPDDVNVGEHEPSFDNRARKVVTAEVRHFSSYAVAYRR